MEYPNVTLAIYPQRAEERPMMIYKVSAIWIDFAAL